MYPETLSANGFRALLRLGLPCKALAQAFPNVRERISRWGQADLQSQTRVPGLQAPVILERAILAKYLRQTALDREIEVASIDAFNDAQETRDGVHMSVEMNGDSLNIHARFCIDASGRPALLARKLGVKRVTLDHLISFWVSGPANVDFACTVATISIPDGWIFWASDASGNASIGFFTAGRQRDTQVTAGYVMSRLPTEIARMVTSLEVWETSDVSGVNASTSALQQPGGIWWLACGDALQTFDPLASMGLTVALNQAEAAAKTIRPTLAGDTTTMAQYWQAAKSSFDRYLLERNAYYGHKR